MENNDGKQVEIGKSLHDARVAKGLSLDDIQKTTKIQKHYLEAIEQENFDELPGDFYVRAFIKQFADTVGLNGIELLNEHDENLPDTHSPEYVAEVSGEDVSRRIANQNREQRRDSMRRYIPTIGIVIGIVVVICVIWGVVVHTNNSSQTSISSSSVSVTGSSESSHSATKSHDKKNHSSKKSVATKKISIKKVNMREYDVKSDKPTTITLKANARAWSSVESNGKTIYQGSQMPGDKKAVKLANGVNKVTLSLGNVKGTKIYLNGTEVKLDNNIPLTTQLTFNFKK